ncbi:MAG: hypothetical protein R2705_16420 [Ilumatobacteraceae bacterium]
MASTATTIGLPLAVPISSMEASCVAPDSVESSGNRISFSADQLVDGEDDTAWRCAGDGKGVTLTATLEQPSTVRAVARSPVGSARTPT